MYRLIWGWGDRFPQEGITVGAQVSLTKSLCFSVSQKVYHLWFFTSCTSYYLGLVVTFFFFFSIWPRLVLVVGRQFFVAACVIFSCGMRTFSWGMWNLVPWPGMEPGPPALGAQSLSHWTTREVPVVSFYLQVISNRKIARIQINFSGFSLFVISWI